MTYGDILIPSWCGYPEPTMGELGCFSLISGFVKSQAYCKDCDLFKNIMVSQEEETRISNNQEIIRAYILLDENTVM